FTCVAPYFSLRPLWSQLIPAFPNRICTRPPVSLPPRVWKSNDDDNWVAAGAVPLDFHFVRIHAVNRGRINFRQHRCGRVAENRCAEKRQISLESEIPRLLEMWSNVQGLRRTVFDKRNSKTLRKKIEQGTSTECHRFEYLTLLNTSQDARTRDRQSIDEYNLWGVLDSIPPDER